MAKKVARKTADDSYVDMPRLERVSCEALVSDAQEGRGD
jgi:hypothetical protein